MTRGAVRALSCAGAVLALATGSAEAELVELTTGRVVSVRGIAYEGDRVTLFLRAGGEVSCPASLVARVEPDEVSWDVPTPPGPNAATSPAPGARPPRPYDRLITAAAMRHALDASLLHAIVRAESGYQPRARSPKGARGLMQLMPAVLEEYGVSNPYDPAANLEAGARHLGRLLDRYPLDRALAAYNAGEAAVERHGGIPPYPETRAYVAGILRELSDGPEH